VVVGFGGGAGVEFLVGSFGVVFAGELFDEGGEFAWGVDGSVGVEELFECPV
jgi:hypothetical protein